MSRMQETRSLGYSYLKYIKTGKLALIQISQASIIRTSIIQIYLTIPLLRNFLSTVGRTRLWRSVFLKRELCCYQYRLIDI